MRKIKVNNNDIIIQKDVLGRKLYDLFPQISPYSSVFLEVDKELNL